ncbi:MAG: TPM domain-containing protein [Selenomonadaceae bacterium]|nr:TPM domain-containing protein [Selenomonadaceae bacterium]
MIKKICATVLIFFAMSFSVTFATMPENPLDISFFNLEGGTFESAVFDNSQTLSESEIQSLNNQIKSVEQKHGVRVGVEFVKSIGNLNIASAAHELLNQNYGDGQNGGIIFLVVMDSRQWYVATDSKMNNLVSANEVGNYLLPNLRDGDYYGACNNYVEAVDDYLTYYELNGAVYDSSGVLDPNLEMFAVMGEILASTPVEQPDTKALNLEDKMLDAAVFDNSQTLSKSEIQALTNQIKSVEQKHGVKIGVEFLKSIGNRDIATAARELLNQNYGDGQNGGIIFLVVMDSRSWYVATDSKMNNLVSENDIGNYLLPNLRDGDYYGACSSYVDAVDKSLSYYEQNDEAYDSSVGFGFNPIAAMVAVIGGIFFGIMVRSWLMGTMSNVHHEVKATDYLKRETVKFIKNKDIYLFTNVERRAKPSGGQSMGHSGGGGGHSGGGGGAGGSF